MTLFSEIVVLGHTHVHIHFADDGRYRLAYGELVVYENGSRRLRGRTAPYEVRSVEQLRYDFERDIESIGGRLG